MGCDNGSEGGIGSAFASPAVSRGAVEKAGTGRSRPRLVKVRKPLNSHNGGLGPGSVSGSNPIDSGFNPFQSGLEISDRVKKSVNTSNGFSDLIGNNKFENVGFGFSGKGGDWMSNSHLSEFGGSVGILGCKNFVKFENLGFVFGANECDLGRNMGSEKRGLAESVGQMGANDTGKMNMECGENVGKFENKGFVFGGKRDLGLNLNLGHGESNENFKKPGSDDKGKTKIEQEAGLRKFGNVDFVFGAHHSGLASNSDSEKRGNMGTLNLDDISKMKMPTELECGKYAEVGFVFGANRCDMAKNSNSENAEFSENGGKLVPDETTTKIKSDQSEHGKNDNLGFVHSGSASNSNVEKKSTENSGTEISDNLERMNVQIETDFMNMKATTVNLDSIVNGSLNLDGDYKNGVFIFGSRSKKSAAFDQNTAINGDFNFAFGSRSNTAASGTIPVFKLPDELKKLNINDFKDVDGADKTRDSNVCSSANAEKTFVFGNSKQSFGFPTERAATTSHDWIRNAKMDAHGSDDTVGKTNGTDVKTSDDENFVFGSSENTVSSSGGDKSRNPNTGSGLGDSNEQANLWSSSFGNFGNEKQSVNIDDMRFVDPPAAAAVSSSSSLKSSEVSHILQGHAKTDIKLNGAAAPSSFSPIGLGFQPCNSVSKASSTNKFDFVFPPDGEPFTDFKTPKWDASCSFTAELLPGLNKKLEFSAKSRSVKDKGSKKTRGRHPVVAKPCLQTDFVQKENSSQENPDSPGLYSPMDFSPYLETVATDPCSRETSLISNDSSQQESNCAPSSAHSISPNDAKADLAASREGLDIKEGQEICREPNEQSSEYHIEMGIDELNYGARAECYHPETNQECSSSGAGVAGVASVEAGAGFGSNMEKQESNNRVQYCFASGFEDMSEKKFTFSALSSAHCSISAKRQSRKKNRTKVGHNSFVITPSPDVNLGSSSVQFFPLSSTPSSVGIVEDKKGNISISQNKWENRSEQDEEQVKQRSTTVSAALQEACEKWRLRGNKAYKNGDLSKAEDFYTQGVDSVPPSEISGCCLKPLVLCYSNRAATRISLGKIRQAIADCMMAAVLDPNFLKVQMRAGNCHLVLGEVEDALQYFSKCLESGRIVCLDRRLMIEASDNLLKAQKVAECMKQSAELLKQRTTDAAVTALEKIAEGLSISSYSEKLLEMKAEALFMLRKYEEVIQLCEQTLGFAEKNFALAGNDEQLENTNGFKCKRRSFVRLWRSRLISKSYFHMGRLEVALDLLEKQEYASETVESSIPLAATIRELLQIKRAGNEAFQSGRYTEAVEHYTSALSINVESRPFAAICLCNRAAAHQALGQIADAIADCSLAIALDGSYSKAVSRRATLHERIRDYRQAARDLQRLIPVLEKQSHEKIKLSGTPGRSSGNAKEIKQAHRRLSSMEEKAKNGIPLDLYLILGIKPSETAADIKKAYRKAALRHHPDKAGQFLARSEGGDDGQLWKEIAEEVHKDADRLFKMIGEAYAVLSDPTKRSEYDLEEEIRNSRRETSLSGTSRSSSDAQSYSFERNTNGRYWQETWKTYGNSYSRW